MKKVAWVYWDTQKNVFVLIREPHNVHQQISSYAHSFFSWNWRKTFVKKIVISINNVMQNSSKYAFKCLGAKARIIQLMGFLFHLCTDQSYCGLTVRVHSASTTADWCCKLKMNLFQSQCSAQFKQDRSTAAENFLFRLSKRQLKRQQNKSDTEFSLKTET